MSGRTGFTGGKRDLPSKWAKIREVVFKRDGYRCTQILPSGARCPRGRATGHRLECDHVGSKSDHSMANLTTLCSHHHAQKTSQQGQQAREAKYAVKKPNRPREERHPGLIRRPTQEES